MAALIRKIFDAAKSGAKKIELWGSGEPKREFVYVDDVANATLFLLKNGSDESLTPTNIGGSQEITIKELAKMISRNIGYNGEVLFDLKKPDGVFRKSLSSNKLKYLGWRPSVPHHRHPRWARGRWAAGACSPRSRAPAALRAARHRRAAL